MKPHYFLSYSLIALFIFASCNSKVAEKKPSVYDLVIQSKAVSDLDINLSELDVSNPVEEKNADNSTLLFFRFKNADLKLLIVDATNVNACKAALIAVEDQYLKWSNSDFDSAIKNLQFNGKIGFTSSNGVMLGFQFEKSVLVGVSSPRSNAAARVSECGSWSCDGCNNVFNCAGRRYRDKDWAEKLLWCFWGFFGCLSQDIYTCARDGCPY